MAKTPLFNCDAPFPSRREGQAFTGHLPGSGSVTGGGSINQQMLDKLCEIAENVMNPPRTVVDRDVLYGTDDAGQEIQRVILTFSNGDVEVTDIINGVIQMTQSPSFTTTAGQTDVETQILFATNTDSADAQFGRVVEVQRNDVYVDGVLDPARVQYFDMNQAPPVDLTATVTAAPFDLASAPIRVELAGENLAVTGAAEVALAAIPATATYAEVYIDAPDANIRWTKDGSAPTDNNGEQETAGVTIRLLDRPEIDGFRALTIDALGALDPALTANLTVNYWNVAPDED